MLTGLSGWPLDVLRHALEAAFDDERAQFHEWMEMTSKRAEGARARAEAARARAEAAEAQLERLRVKNEQKRRLLDKYRRLFGWLEKLPSFK